MKKNNKNMKNRDPFELLFDGLSKMADDLPKKLDYPLYFKTRPVGQVNLSNTDKEYNIEVSAPGFSKEELNLEIKEGVLSIKGKHTVDSKESTKKYSRQEFSKSSFLREFTVPEDASNEIEAKFENGILYISLKKKDPPKEESKKIEIK